MSLLHANYTGHVPSIGSCPWVVHELKWVVVKMHYSNIRDSSSVKSPFGLPHFMNEKTEVPKREGVLAKERQTASKTFISVTPLVKPGKTHPQFTGKEIEASDWPLMRSSAIQ